MTDHMDPSKYFVVSIREYDEMKSEIERLRAMCDMLATRLRSGSDSGWDDAIDAWEGICEFGGKPESQGSAKLSLNSETNVDDSIPSDSVKEIAQYLHELSKAYWLSDDDCRTLAQASHMLLYLQRDIGIKNGLLKGWDYRLNKAEEQLAEAHGILSSEAMIRLLQDADHQQDWMVSIVAPLSDYWERYGNAYDQRRSL